MREITRYGRGRLRRLAALVAEALIILKAPLGLTCYDIVMPKRLAIAIIIISACFLLLCYFVFTWLGFASP